MFETRHGGGPIHNQKPGEILSVLLDTIDGRTPACESFRSMLEICQLVDNSKKTFTPKSRSTKSEVYS